MAGRGGLRADAARNRAAILDAARTLIAAHGTEVGMDRIAASAGVAVGTLYRHFPTKNDLVRAIVTELGATIAGTLDVALARIGAGRSTALDELVALVHRVVVTMGQERLLRDALGEAGELHAVRESAERILGRLVAEAHRDRALRPDVTAEDIALLLATSPGDEVPRPARERWVELARRALVAPGA
ncbi:TetR/AcrR family transcriptional regulator [Amycolatopsis sp. 195334CR]|uniref:TetR/AcrR family transcriptional regulator n=1 Tax=Amycolatopsis sp. 195334CR TaxID=2814588 RepID=UPI001A8EBB20|nr:TetR/AcrR family transcriptional regulator [Amycolatopsis sp. 195334CR]MBN6039742.1 helix-turn-helix transcriptional regulator [Amycolatopsis sp. 195334CR]